MYVPMENTEYISKCLRIPYTGLLQNIKLVKYIHKVKHINKYCLFI